jgi:hypothetical protein
MPHELHHERQPDYSGELTLGLAPDGALRFDDGVATVADQAQAEAIADRYAAVVYAGAGDEVDEGAAGTDEEDAFDAAAFVDRTPMEDVVQDIESGEYDEHLDAIETAAERNGVQDAIDGRRG